MSNPVEASVPESAQFRNGLVFMIATSLTYLIAPVTYVGVLHATILESLKASDTVANLPEAVYLWVTPLPLLIAWFWASPRLLRPMLTWALIMKGVAGGGRGAGVCVCTKVVLDSRHDHPPWDHRDNGGSPDHVSLGANRPRDDSEDARTHARLDLRHRADLCSARVMRFSVNPERRFPRDAESDTDPTTVELCAPFRSVMSGDVAVCCPRANGASASRV